MAATLLVNFKRCQPNAYEDGKSPYSMRLDSRTVEAAEGINEAHGHAQHALCSPILGSPLSTLSCTSAYTL